MLGEQLNKFGSVETAYPSTPAPAFEHRLRRQVSSSAETAEDNMLRGIADFFGSGGANPNHRGAAHRRAAPGCERSRREAGGARCGAPAAGCTARNASNKENT
jgi:hypothetical protein